MPATPLAPPTGVTSSLNAGKLTVSWQDIEGADKVANFVVTFLAKDTLAPYTPTPTNTNGYASSLEINAPTEPNAPALQALADNYIASVVAKPKDANAYTESLPGLQTYWTAGLALVISVGSRTFTLTKASATGGVYRLPVSEDSPLQITLGDIKGFADSIGIGASAVPAKWPNGDDITGVLEVYALAVDTDHNLFTLDIAYTLNFTPITGLTIKRVGLRVLRTDGVHAL